MHDKQQTLFERVGGEQTISDLIHEFYDRVLADPELKPFFENASFRGPTRLDNRSRKEIFDLSANNTLQDAD